MSGETAKAKTSVFWDVDDCPIPSGVDPKSIYRNIKSALANEDYDCCNLEFKAYGGKETLEGLALDAGTTFVPKVAKHVREVVFDIWAWALDSPAQSNLLLISKFTPEDDWKLVVTLKALTVRGYNVLLAQPDKVELPFAARSVWLWTSLSNGGSPMEPKGIKQTRSVNTLEPQPETINLARVFWDVVDFRIPVGVHPFMVLDNIESALKKKGFPRWVPIVFYADKLSWPDSMLKHYKKAGSLFVYHDDKFSRVGWMLMDIHIWLLDNHVPGPGAVYNVMIVSNNIADEPEFVRVLEYLKSRCVNVLLVHDKKLEAKSFGTESFEWLWQNLLGGGSSSAGGSLSGGEEPKKTSACSRCGSSIVS